MINRNEALYINNGESAGRNNVCISGYDKSKPNYALSNFENNDGKGYEFLDKDVGKVKFPTAEHYLHFQKLNKEGKLAYQKRFEDEQSPAAILKLIREVPDDQQLYKKMNAQGSPFFDDAAWNKQNHIVQMQINAVKYEQSPAFKQCIDNAIQLGKAFGDNKGAACIIEDTASAAYEEKKWGTGQDGKGTNILGNTQTAFANMVANGQYVTGKSTTPMFGAFNNQTVNEAYLAAEKQYQEGVQLALIEARKNLTTNKNADTSDIDGVEKLTVSDTMVLPQNPKPKNSSKLSPEPEENPDHPSKEQRSRETNLLHPDNVTKVSEHMKTLGWVASQEKVSPTQVGPVVFTKGSEKFTMDVNCYKTDSSDVNTFIAMLQAYQVSHPGKQPRITCNNDAMKSLWEEAYKTVYNQDPPAATIRVTPPSKQQAPKEPSEPEVERAGPRPR